MRIPSKLKRFLTPTNRVFGLTVIPVLVATVWALIALGHHPDNENDQVAARALRRVAPALEQALNREGEELERLGIVIAKNPKFFAVLNLPKAERAQADFKNALDNVLRDFQRDADTPFFEVMDETGSHLGRALRPATGMTDISVAPFVRAAVAGRTGRGYVIEKGKLYRVVTVPVTAGGPNIGVLCLGRSVDTEMAERFKGAIGCDVAFTVTDEIQATTLVPSPLRKILAQRVSERSLAGTIARKAKNGDPPPAQEFDVITTGGERFVAVRRTPQGPSIGGELAYVLIRPLTSKASPLAAIRREFLYAGGAGLLLALMAGAYIAIDARRRRRRSEDEHQAALHRLTEVVRVRTGFMASASEEVLEPAQTIRTIIELIEEGALGDLTGPQLEGILSMRSATERLARVGNDLANLSLLDRDELSLSFESADVGNLVESAAVVVVPIASERKQSVMISVEPRLVHPRVDAEHLSKAILNLALNAARFSPDGGRIEMTARHIDLGVSINVSNSGPDLPEGAEVSVSQLGLEHAGLGMAVAIGIVEAHGGSISVLSQPGAGNIFTIELPFPSVEPMPIPATPLPPEVALRLAS
jgi:signal transduction histidine kinase